MNSWLRCFFWSLSFAILPFIHTCMYSVIHTIVHIHISFKNIQRCILVTYPSNNCCTRTSKLVDLHYAACHHIHEWMSFIARRGCADCHNRGARRGSCHWTQGDYAAWWCSDPFVTLLYWFILVTLGVVFIHSQIHHTYHKGSLKMPWIRGIYSNESMWSVDYLSIY